MFLVTAPLLPMAFLVCYNCGVKPGVKLSHEIYTHRRGDRVPVRCSLQTSKACYALLW